MFNFFNKPTLTILAVITPQLIIASLVVWWGGSEDHYFNAIPAKYQVASETPSPKIILAGGSSVAWGSDSETFTRICGRPCVNLGLNAGQGLAFRLSEAIGFCEPGDAIVLSLEYNELSTKPYGQIVAKTLLYSPSSAQFISSESIRSALDEGVLELVASRTRIVWSKLVGQFENEPLYLRSNFNVSGDFVGHENRQPPNRQSRWTIDVYPAATEYLTRLKIFDQACQDKGVTVFYRLPCIPKSTITKAMLTLGKTENQLAKIFGARMLNRLPDTLLSDDCFFDTPYHLVHREKIRASEKLAEQLNARLIANPEQP
jgi:hypothetical protein